MIDSRDELFQLTTALLFKLGIANLRFSDMEQRVDNECPDGIEWNFEQTVEWFVESFVSEEAATKLLNG